MPQCCSPAQFSKGWPALVRAQLESWNVGHSNLSLSFASVAGELRYPGSEASTSASSSLGSQKVLQQDHLSKLNSWARRWKMPCRILSASARHTHGVWQASWKLSCQYPVACSQRDIYRQGSTAQNVPPPPLGWSEKCAPQPPPSCACSPCTS